ncbi:hypothetical protein EXN32_21915 [Agrobacterium tumefaciens]|uniref:phage adaptor protein n=1 Tax=Agrobacterium TaxID=357 RepID=UPI00115F23EA|nr:MULTISPECIES: hypothetical protein [Agrobacterium]MDA5241135.1 hypothetical protein [Agrobacterium sp. MAFF310724]MDA5249574.1 hypothetical protein [Agrobacterium sp. MAFF210268]TRB12363.1 hypothetical protein EXN32_21915 [Agrobacterium tumefaciens]
MIGTYQQLVTAVQDYSLRSDAPIDLFIRLAESDIAPFLIHYRAETETTININASNTVTLPANHIKTRAISVDGVTPTPVGIFDNKIYPDQITYYQSGNQLNFRSIDKLNKATIAYYARIPALSSIDNTNWLLTFYPSVYLYGVLSRLYKWAKDAEAEQDAKASMMEAINALLEDHKQGTTVTNPIQREVTHW